VLPRDSLELDLGVDSLGRVEVASELEKILGLKITDELMSQIFTVNDLIIACKRLAPENTPPAAEKSLPKSGLDSWGEKLEVLPEERSLKNIAINPSLISNITHSFVADLFKLFFKIFYRIRVEGSENIPKKGPYIIYANHTSFFDGLIMATSVPRYARPGLFLMAFRVYFDMPIIRNLVRFAKIIL